MYKHHDPTGATRKLFPQHLGFRAYSQIFAVVLLCMFGASWHFSKTAIACGPPPPPPFWGRGTFLFKSSPASYPIAGASEPISVSVPVEIFISSTTNSIASPTAPECTPAMTTVELSMVCAPSPPPFPPPGPVVGSVTIPTPTTGPFSVDVPVTIPAGAARSCLLTGTATTTWENDATSTGTGDVLLCIVEPAPGQPPALASDARLALDLLSPPVQTIHPGDQARYVYRVTNNDSTHAVTIDLSVDSEQAGRMSVGSPEPDGSGEGTIGLADPGTGDNFPIVFSDDLLLAPGPGNNYLLDDGAQGGAIGGSIDSILWFNQFNATAGQTFIDKVSVAFGAGADDRVIALGIYADPDGNGFPDDAVLLSRTQRDEYAANAGTGTFNEYTIEPTFVGEPGTSFFVGVLMSDASGVSPAAHDSSPYAGRSFIAQDVSCNMRLDFDDSAPGFLLGPANVNLMLRAHGRLSRPRPPWIQLPPDPTVTSVPVIERTLRLCPGETRLIEIDTRGWGMCLTGSGCESRMSITGMFDDGSPAMACAGTSVIVDASVPPDFLCGDGGVFTTVVPQGGSLAHQAVMPTHTVNITTTVANAAILPSASPMLSLGPVTSFVLESEGFRGRHVSTLDNGGGTAALPGETLTCAIDVNIASVEPGIVSQLIELHPHAASPAVDETYFFVLARSRLSGGTIPPGLDTYCDSMIYFNLDGVRDSVFHESAIINQATIDVQIIDPTTLRATFQAAFPSDANGDCSMDGVVDVGDIAPFVAAQLMTGNACADINQDGSVNGRDVQPFVDRLLGIAGMPVDEIVLQVDASVNAWGVEFLLFDEPIPSCPGGSQGQLPNHEQAWRSGQPGAEFATAENFDIPAGGTITEINWWGGYLPDASCPDGADAFTVAIFNDDANGVPGSLVVQLDGQVPTRTATGRGYLQVVEEYAFSLGGLDINLAPGCYWLLIGYDESVNGCEWYWGRSFDGDGVRAVSNFGNGFIRLDDGTPFGSESDLAWCIDLSVGDNASCLLPQGACCSNDGATCDDVSEVECASIGGDWDAGLSCATDPCPIPLPNDDCVDAIAIGDGTTLFDTTGALDSGVLPTGGCSASTVANDVWFEYTATCTGNLTIDTEGSVAPLDDSVLAVYDTACGGARLACDDDGGSGLLSTVTIPVTMGDTLIIQAFGFGTTNDGPGQLNIACASASMEACCFPDLTCSDEMVGDCAGLGGTGQGGGTDCDSVSCPQPPPANDDCANAEAISIGGIAIGNTDNATPDGLGTCGTSAGTNGAVWYSVIGDGTTLTAELCGSPYDSKIQIYEDGCATLTCVTGEDDDFTNCGGNDPLVDWCAAMGVEYLIAVQGFSASTGDYTLTVTSDATPCP